MLLTVSDEEGRVTSMDMGESELIENVKALLEVEFSIPVRNQTLMHNGRALENGVSLEAAGVKAGDLLLVRRGSPTPSSIQELERMSSYEGLVWSDIPNNINPNLLHRILKGNPRMLRELEHMNSKMYEAARKDDPADLRAYMIQQQLNRSLARREQARRAQQLNDNPFDVEGQKQIEEEIQRRNIESNLEMAMEHMPEAFARVTMLYVDAEVNSIPLKAFIDSGAQTTIMSKKCAERCGVMRLVDTRFAGQAVGVGTAKIIGKIHMASLKLGHIYLQCSFTVLDQDDMDLLFGLDMLKRHQCIIDLKANCLRFTGSTGNTDSVPFLAEKDIPHDSFGHGRGRGGGGGSTSPQSSVQGSGTSSAPKPGLSQSVQAPAPAPAGSGTGSPSSDPSLDPALFESMRGFALPGQQQTSIGPAQAPTQAQPPSGSQFPEDKITRIMSMGTWTRAQVVEALTVSNGNEDAAVNYLFTSYS